MHSAYYALFVCLFACLFCMYVSRFPKSIFWKDRSLCKEQLVRFHEWYGWTLRNLYHCVEIALEDSQKFLKLLEILGLYQERGSILVFVHKQEHADELMKNLLRHSYACMSIHGGIDQYDRDSTMDDFKAGNIKLLVSTTRVFVLFLLSFLYGLRLYHCYCYLCSGVYCPEAAILGSGGSVAPTFHSVWSHRPPTIIWWILPFGWLDVSPGPNRLL